MPDFGLCSARLRGTKGGGLWGIGLLFRVSSRLRGPYEFDSVRERRGFLRRVVRVFRGQDRALGLGPLMIFVDPDSVSRLIQLFEVWVWDLRA